MGTGRAYGVPWCRAQIWVCFPFCNYKVSTNFITLTWIMSFSVTAFLFYWENRCFTTHPLLPPSASSLGIDPLLSWCWSAQTDIRGQLSLSAGASSCAYSRTLHLHLFLPWLFPLCGNITGSHRRTVIAYMVQNWGISPDSWLLNFLLKFILSSWPYLPSTCIYSSWLSSSSPLKFVNSDFHIALSTDAAKLLVIFISSFLGLFLHLTPWSLFS